MICQAFDRWLDQGMPPGGEAAFLDHAASCPACARARAAAEALEGALTGSPIRLQAPAGFADRVMSRIEHPVLAPMTAPATPWWLRALTEPAGMLAMLLIAIMTTGWKLLWAVLGSGAMVLAQGASGSLLAAAGAATQTSWGALLGRPEVALGLELGALCVAVVAVPVLYRLSLHTVSRATRAGRR